MLMMVKKSLIFVVSAPSGTGKTTLVNALVSGYSGLYKSISHTTRKPRSRELDGENYHFVTTDEFLQMKARGDFVETAEIYSHYYGTSRFLLDQVLLTGMDIVLEVDYQGFEQVKRLWGQRVCGIFVMPPNLSVLRERLQKRGQDTEEEIEKRLAFAEQEIQRASFYDFVVFNYDVEKVLEQLRLIVDCSSTFVGRYF